MNGRRLTHQDIADALRGRIHGGELRPGAPIPTQSQLVAEFGVERGAVRRALELLHDEGLLTGATRGAPPRVVDPSEREAVADDEPQPTMVALAARMARAFAVPDVRIDSLGLTSETLMLALSEPLRRIHEGRIRPGSVTARILLPASSINLAFPSPVDAQPDDHAVHDRWLAQRNAQGQVLRHSLQALHASHGIDVRISFRALPLTPPVKLYVLNGTEALFGYYKVTRREEEINSTPVEMYDALGTESLLFPFRAGSGPRDAAFVEQAQQWFDALWNTIASDLTLS